VLGDHPQIVGDPTPADPASHARVAVGATAAQAVPSVAPPDAPFHAGPPVAALAEPRLLRVDPARRRRASRARPHHLLHPALLGCRFIAWGRQFAVASKPRRRASELPDAAVEPGNHRRGIVGMARKHPGWRDDPALDPAQPADAPRLHRRARLPLTDDRGVEREPADQLLARRPRRILEHAPRRLRKHLRAPWHEGRNGFRPPPGQAVCLLRNLGVEVRLNLPGLRTHLPGQVWQALVVLLILDCGLPYIGRLMRLRGIQQEAVHGL
jgi:hypothetical protein